MNRYIALYVSLLISFGCSHSDGGPGARLIEGQGPKGACGSSSDCGNKEPICDGNQLRCVQCTGDADCGAGKPACDYRDGSCRECTDDRHCSGATPICDTLEQKCQALCESDGDCRNKQLPRCDVDSGRCFACDNDADCSRDKQQTICDDFGVCVECATDRDCGPKRPYCAPPQGRCEECRGASDCGADKPYCLDFHCRECLSNADCPSDAPLCGGDAKCKRCECDREFGDCSSGTCVCGAGLTACGPACVDVSNDPRHCGGCGRSCDDDSMCVGGACVCRPDLIGCGGKCVDPRSDPWHCGGCDQRCDARCFDGACTTDSCVSLSAVECGDRGGACVAQQSIDAHPLHCGGCDRPCKEHQLCASGACRDYEPGRACNSCPCSDCGDRQCCPHPLASGLVFCVAGDRCPGAF